MIQAVNLSKTYSRLLFKNVNFKIRKGARVGLVGLNGCGKSTLFRIIAGLETSESGKIINNNEKIGYLPQILDIQEYKTVKDFLTATLHDPFSEWWKIDKIIEQFNLQDINLSSSLEQISPGQLMKLHLAKLLLQDATLLLLDEPTNHLDIEGILWLENFIKKFKGSVMIISHDRMFMNNTVNQIFEIDEQKLKIYIGNYEDFKAQKSHNIQKRHSIYIMQQKHIKSLEQTINIARKMNNKKGGNIIKSVKKRIDRIQTKGITDYIEQKIKDFRIDNDISKKQLVLMVKNITFGYDNTNLIHNANFKIKMGEKVWLYGPNGAGKTTLLKIILGQLSGYKGDIIWGQNIKYAYFAQTHAHFDLEQTVEEFFVKHANIPYYSFQKVLKNFLFPIELQKYQLKDLSPGQRVRLYFAAISKNTYNFLILDEPTNHLDIETKEVIESALNNFTGAILLVSHDRAFAYNIGVSQTLFLSDGKLFNGHLMNDFN